MGHRIRLACGPFTGSLVTSGLSIASASATYIASYDVKLAWLVIAGEEFDPVGAAMALNAFERRHL
jgi:hypothetical protein